MKNIMTETAKLKKAIKNIQNQISALDVDPDDHEDAYCEALDCEGPVYVPIYSHCDVGSLTFDPSEILRELDPIVYRRGLNDFADGIQVEDTAEYKELAEELETLEEELKEIEEETVG